MINLRGLTTSSLPVSLAQSSTSSRARSLHGKDLRRRLRVPELPAGCTARIPESGAAFLHALAHLQDDGHAADVHSRIAGQRQNKFQALQILIGVEARVAFGTGGFEQAFAFVKAQGLGMDAIHFGDAQIMYAPLDFRFVTDRSLASILEPG